MTYIVSISDRGLVYLPKELKKKLKIDKTKKIKITVVEGNKVEMEAIDDFFSLAGVLKKKMPKDFDFREYMEKHYDKMDRY